MVGKYTNKFYEHVNDAREMYEKNGGFGKIIKDSNYSSEELFPQYDEESEEGDTIINNLSSIEDFFDSGDLIDARDLLCESKREIRKKFYAENMGAGNVDAIWNSLDKAHKILHSHYNNNKRYY